MRTPYITLAYLKDALHAYCCTMRPRTTLREIADRAGVHFTTVSRALRNHPGIPAETRVRLQQLAAEMGYSPDPFVSALNAYRLTKQRVSFHGTIAWLHGYPHKITHAGMFRGAEQRARELGYKLEVFQLAGESATPMRRLERIFSARNIRNLIVAPQFNVGTSIDIDWERYSAITVSHSLSSPRLHLVTNDQAFNILIAMKQLRARGYKRIGLLLEQRLIRITGHRWLSGYLTAREELLPKDRLDVLVFDEPAPTSVLRTWFKRNRPDAIITEHGFWQKRLHGDLGLECPGDLGVALVALRENSPFAGIAEQADRVGAVAVEQLVRMEHSDERGVPDHPVKIYIEGQWRDGPSVGPVVSARASS